MQSTESFPNKSKMIEMSHHPSLYHHLNHNKTNIHKNNTTTTTIPESNNSSNNISFISSSLYCETMSSGSSSSSNSTAVVDGVGVGVGGGSLYCNLSTNNNNNNNKVDYWNDLYDVVGATSSVQRTFLPLTNSSCSSPKSSGRGEMGATSKGGGFFTVRQWEELERQIMICKYMMASIPVPPHLLLTLSNITTSPYTTSQSNHQSTTSCKMDVRYTRGGGTNNDAEPWRCRRTDGKKWRCSRDVVPYQKYCERHAHKPRPRSRKPVEPQQSQVSTNTNAGINSINNNNNSTRQVFNIPAMISGATTYAQPRCTEWFMKGDPIPGSSLNEQWQQLVQPSSKEGLKLYDEHDRAVSLFQKHYGEELHTNTYLNMNDESTFQNQLDSDHEAQTTRHFIDAWSCAEREVETGNVSTQTPKLPLSSLTLSMSGGTEIDDNNENSQLSFKSDWLDANPYMCSTPGGPLGEALCLGMSSTAKGQLSNLHSPHGYNSNSTTTSTCSKSSCEDNAHGLHFR